MPDVKPAGDAPQSSPVLKSPEPAVKTPVETGANNAPPKPFKNEPEKASEQTDSQKKDPTKPVRVLRSTVIATESGGLRFNAGDKITDPHLIAILHNSDADTEPC